MSEYTWVGLDAYAESITAAILHGERDHAEVVTLPGDLMKVRRLFRQLAAKGPVRSCYEASGAGFVLHRVLAEDGLHREVIAPSLIPRKPGDRRKTDRLDAVNLARLYRSGHLTPVHVPSTEQEALRRLIRLRYTYQCYTTATKHRVSGMLRNHGHVFTDGRTAWTKTHRQWLARFATNSLAPCTPRWPPRSSTSSTSRCSATPFDTEIERFAQSPPYRDRIQGLCCLRSVKTLTAMSLIAEIDDVQRFRSPRALMAYFGLVPSERSSGERDRRGPIT